MVGGSRKGTVKRPRGDGRVKNAGVSLWGGEDQHTNPKNEGRNLKAHVIGHPCRQEIFRGEVVAKLPYCVARGKQHANRSASGGGTAGLGEGPGKKSKINI